MLTNRINCSLSGDPACGARRFNAQADQVKANTGGRLDIQQETMKTTTLGNVGLVVHVEGQLGGDSNNIDNRTIILETCYKMDCPHRVRQERG